MKFNERLRALREDKDINQTELAKAVGSGQKSISFFETGRYEPSIEIILKMAKYFNVSTDYLLGASNIPRKFGE